VIVVSAFQTIADKGHVPSLDEGVILDTQVLIDFAFQHRPRHEAAVRLFESLRSTDIPVVIPGHAIFEYQSAFRQASNDPSSELAPQARSAQLYHLYPVSIDQALFDASARFSLPRLRGGDLVFVALAAVLERPLVTEDSEIRGKAAELQVSVHSINEYLQGGAHQIP
jgi:predicted nucleic acid-binding protein